ncbi:MAG TPA: GntR family transcriptional regulator [Mycobacteriales bacterium]|nr:GntR family transcriptional regulator [Mycobacteriales bacterium]
MTAPEPVIFAPVVRASVSDDVYRQLRDAIVGGAIEPGSSLAGERALAEQFGVNRHALREAIRRLEQARLVEVSHGGATRVLDWRTNAGLELLAELGASVEVAPAVMIRSVVEMRRAIGVDAARLAADRIPRAAARELVAHVEELAARTPPPDLADLGASYDVLWRMIVAASDNLAYQLADNSLVEALHRMPELALQLSEGEITDLATQRALVLAIAAGDQAEAADVADRLLSRMVEAAAAVRSVA